MGLNLEEKQAVVAEISAEVAQAQAIVVAEYRGLGVAAMTDLRKKRAARAFICGSSRIRSRAAPSPQRRLPDCPKKWSVRSLMAFRAIR